MRLSSILSTLFLTSSLTLALPSNLLLKESTSIPEGWSQLSTPPPEDTLLTFKLGLKQPKLFRLQDKLQTLFDPSVIQTSTESLSKEEIDAHLKPDTQDLENVKAWLKKNEVALVGESENSDWLTIKAPVSKADEMLGAKFTVFQNENNGKRLTRTLQYSLPTDVYDSIDTITGTTEFPFLQPQVSTVRSKELPSDWTPPSPNSASRISSQSSSSSAPPSCQTNVTTIECYRELYGTVDYQPRARDNNVIAVASFLEQYANYQDLSQFTQKYRPEAYEANYTFGFASINGGLNDQSMPGLEANLDTQMVAGMAFPVKSTEYSTAGRPPYTPDSTGTENNSEPYSDFLSYLLSLPDSKLPSVVTMSYGDTEQTVPKSYAHKVCNQISALVARRVTVISSSGDFGVGVTGPNGTCTSNGNGPVKEGVERFRPSFPCTCPWVTCIGATENFAPEKAVSMDLAGFYGGGGFSDFFKVPLYQIKATSSYLVKLGKKNKGLFSPLGRGVPDIAAQGSNFATVTGGKNLRVYGTSVSAPLVASIVSQLNDARLAKGLPNLGFLNPLIYSVWAGTKALNDVTIGSNPSCNTTGFPAEKGWDAVTGYGTPNFFELLKTVT